MTVDDLRVVGDRAGPGGLLDEALEAGGDTAEGSVVLLASTPTELAAALGQVEEDRTARRVVVVTDPAGGSGPAPLQSQLRRAALVLASRGRCLNTVVVPGREQAPAAARARGLTDALAVFLPREAGYLVGQVLDLSCPAAVRPFAEFLPPPVEVPALSAAVVVGASGGVGRATALALARLGCRVGLLARRRAELEAVASEVRGLGGEAVMVTADVTDAPCLDGALRLLAGELGDVGALVYAAGVVGPGDVTTPQGFAHVMDVNFNGFVTACRTYLDICRTSATGGSVVAIGSVSTLDVPVPGVDAYCASKAAMLQLVRSISIGQARRGIVAQCVSPGPIETAMTKDLKPGLRSTWSRAVPLGRFGEPEEVAHVIARFAGGVGSPALTGQHVHVDGGFSLRRSCPEEERT